MPVLLEERRLKGKTKGELTFVRKNGEKFPGLLSSHIFHDENGHEKTSMIIIDLSATKIAEDQIKESENYYRTVFEHTGTANIIVEEDTTISRANAKFLKLSGYSREEIEGKKSWTEFVVKDDLEKMKEYHRLRRIDPSSVPLIYDFKFNDRNGNLKNILLEVDMIPNTKKSVASLLDITQRKNAEKSLQKSEERYRTLFESNPDYTILLNLDGVILDVNTAATEVIGRSKEDLVGKNFTELGIFPEEDQISHEETFRSLLNGEFIPPHESKFIDVNDEIRWEEIVLTTIKKDGVPTSVLVISSDITKRKHDEEIIKESENRYRMVGQLISDFAYSCVHNKSGKYEIDWITDSFYNLTGFTEKELDLNRCWMFTVHPEDEQIAHNQLERLKVGSKNVNDFRIINSNGEVRWLRNHVECVKDNDLDKLRIYGAAEDITYLKNALKDLEQSEERFRALINNSGDLIRILDENGKIIFDSPSSARILGYPEGSLIGKSPLEFIHPDDLERVNNDLAEVYENRNPGIPTEFRIRKADGEYLPVESVSQNMTNVPGIGGIVVTTHPIKERKEMEDEIRASLQEKEILLKEIHHRVKNNMQIISSLLNLQIRFENLDETVGVLKESQGRVKTMAMVHEKLYQSDSFAKINIKEYLENLVSDIFYSYGIKTGSIESVLDIEDININIDTAIPLGLIVNELVTNSVKYAFPQGEGTIKIKITSLTDETELIIADNGIGVPEDFDIEKIETLGLQLVNNLVNQIDGDIGIDGSNGTEYKITFKELKYKERL